MAQALEDVLSTFTPEQRARVEARARELIEEALTLRDLRHAQHLTHERMAELLGVEQENVSRIERRADVLLSTLVLSHDDLFCSHKQPKKPSDLGSAAKVICDKMNVTIH